MSDVALPAVGTRYANLHALLEPLTDRELAWVMARSQADSDAEAAELLDIGRQHPLGGGYDKERLAQLRCIATALRRERALAVQVAIERASIQAVQVLAESMQDDSSRIRLDSAMAILDRYLGKPAVHVQHTSPELGVLAELTAALRDSLPTVEEVEQSTRAADDAIQTANRREQKVT